VDEKAKRKRSGKRAIIGDIIAICTVEICNRILAVEKLSRQKKRKCDKKCKSKARISEEVSKDEELAEGSSESDSSDCIIVGSA
jgi:hypothetical protein